jgi:hypothetical protein
VLAFAGGSAPVAAAVAVNPAVAGVAAAPRPPLAPDRCAADAGQVVPAGAGAAPRAPTGQPGRPQIDPAVVAATARTSAGREQEGLCSLVCLL